MALVACPLALGLVASAAAATMPKDGGGKPRVRRVAEMTIKVGFLSDCEGAFGSFFEPDIASGGTWR